MLRCYASEHLVKCSVVQQLVQEHVSSHGQCAKENNHLFVLVSSFKENRQFCTKPEDGIWEISARCPGPAVYLLCPLGEWFPPGHICSSTTQCSGLETKPWPCARAVLPVPSAHAMPSLPRLPKAMAWCQRALTWSSARGKHGQLQCFLPFPGLELGSAVSCLQFVMWWRC